MGLVRLLVPVLCTSFSVLPHQWVNRPSLPLWVVAANHSQPVGENRCKLSVWTPSFESQPSNINKQGYLPSQYYLKHYLCRYMNIIQTKLMSSLPRSCRLNKYLATIYTRFDNLSCMLYRLNGTRQSFSWRSNKSFGENFTTASKSLKVWGGGELAMI